jgi:hypothetical protein
MTIQTLLVVLPRRLATFAPTRPINTDFLGRDFSLPTLLVYTFLEEKQVFLKCFTIFTIARRRKS